MTTLYLNGQEFVVSDAKYTDSQNVLHDVSKLVMNGVVIYPNKTIFIVSNYSATGWKQMDGYENGRYSDNAGETSGTATMSYRITGTTIYGIYVISDGEQSYDYVTVSITDENGVSVYYKSCKSNEYDQKLEVSGLKATKTYSVVITYRKDGSNDSYTDRGYVMLHARYKDTDNNVSLASWLDTAYKSLNKIRPYTISASKTSVSYLGEVVSLGNSGAKSYMGDTCSVTYEIVSDISGIATLNGSTITIKQNESLVEKSITVRAKATRNYWPSSDKSTASVYEQYSNTISITQGINSQPCKIVFNANGGSGSVPSDITFSSPYATSDIGSACPTRSGYTFRGWSFVASYHNKRICYGTSYGGGTDKNSVKAQTTSSNWSFVDYYTYFGLAESDIPESNGYKVLTLYAQWEDTSCAVHIEPASGHSDRFGALNINNNTGATTRDLTLNMGDSLKMQALMSKGYLFDYFKIGTNTYPVNPLTIHVNDDLNVYMYGKNQQYRITFDANGGSGSVPADIVLDGLSGKSDITSTKPTRSGYKFIGWSRGASVMSPRISYVAISSNDYGSSIGTSSWNIETYLSNLEASYNSLVNSGDEKVLTLYAQWEAEGVATYRATLSGSNIADFQMSTNGTSFSSCSNTMPITDKKRYWFKAVAKSGYEVVSYTIRYDTPTSSGTTFSGDTAEIYASTNIYITFTTQATSSGGGGSTGSQTCTVDLNGEWQYVSTVTDSDGVSYKMYKSKTTAHSGISKMKVTWTGNSAFKVKLWSDSEASASTSISTSSYDYAIALKSETAVASDFDPYANKSDIKAHTKGIGSGAGAPSSSNSANWREADYSGTSNGYAWILYRKDASISSGGDCGYLMIPISANITN